METPEIVQGLKGLRQCDDPDCASFKCKTIDAAIARLSATCETCAFGKHVDVFDVIKCVNPASFAFTLRVPTSESCSRHTPRVPAREGE